MNIFLMQIKKDLVLHWRQRSECWQPLLFFVLVCIIFPLAMSARPALLQHIGVAVLWVAALLSTLLSLPHLYKSDFDDGSIDQYLLCDYPLGFLVMAKVLVAWMVFALPLIAVTPLLALMYGLPASELALLMLMLLLATPTLYLIGSMVAALTVGLQRNGLLLALLLIPLYIPTLIFAANGVLAQQAHQPIAAPVALLFALLLFSLVIAPFVSVFALRLGVAYGR